MKKLFVLLVAMFAFSAVPALVMADELPEIAPYDPPAIPPLDAPAPDGD